MKYEVFYSGEARADLRKLDSLSINRILKKIDFWQQQENPLRFAQPLKGIFKGRYKFRVGDYRIIFRVDSKGAIIILFILQIRHRREVYRV